MSRIVILAFLFAVAALGQSQPDVTFPAISIPASAGQLCHFTAPPLIITPSHTFVSYHCFNPDTAYVAHLNLVTMTFSPPVLSSSAPGVIFRNQPIPITTDTAFVYTLGEGAMAASVRALKGAPEWQWNRYGSNSLPTVWQNMAFLPLGVHVVSGMNVTSLLAVDLGTGSVLWEKTFSQHSVVGSAVVYEGRVIFPVDLALWSLNVTSGPAGAALKQNEPCYIQGLASGQQLNLQLVRYGQDINGPLNALMLYAETAGGIAGNFTICRVHHGWNFGLPEWVHSRGDAYDVQGVTAGGGVIMFAMYNTATQLYSIVLFNATVASGANPIIQEIFRSSVDKYNTPAVLTGSGNALPVMAYSQGGQLVGMSISNVAGLQQVWKLNYQCARAITLFNDGSSTRGFCVPYSQGPAVSFNYNGTVVWTYPNVQTMYPAFQYRGTSIFLTFSNSIVGVSVDASVTMPPGPAPSGTSPGIIVLIVIIIALIGVLCFGIWRSVTKKRAARRSASKANEGYTGLNA